MLPDAPILVRHMPATRRIRVLTAMFRSVSLLVLLDMVVQSHCHGQLHGFL